MLPVPVEVVAELPHRVGVQMVDAPVAGRLAGDDPGVLQHPQVHGHGGPADRHARGDPADIQGPGREPPDDPPPGGIAERVQRGIYVNIH